MGLLDILKKINGSRNTTTENGMLGPTYLDGFTKNIDNPKNLNAHEWRRQLKTDSGKTKFKIKFYGNLTKGNNPLITNTEFSACLIFAFEPSSQQEILLFDGCKHGYNALFCDEYSLDQITNRSAEKYYKDAKGNNEFEIIISTYNGIDYENEFLEQIDENSHLEILDGTKIKFETAKRNGFDVLQIWGTNQEGNIIEIVSEELS